MCLLFFMMICFLIVILMFYREFGLRCLCILTMIFLSSLSVFCMMYVMASFSLLTNKIIITIISGLFHCIIYESFGCNGTQTSSLCSSLIAISIACNRLSLSTLLPLCWLSGFACRSSLSISLM